MDLMNRKRRPSLILLGSIAVGLIAILIVYVLLIATGVVSGRRNVLVLAPASLEKEYDGLPLQAEGLAIVSGSIKAGHTVSVTMEGSQTTPGVGKSRILSFMIRDALGNDVTSTYEYELREGSLTVSRRKLVLWSGGGEKTYDGVSLWNNHWGYESGSLLDGHRLNVELPTTQLEVGSALNEIYARVTDRTGQDVSYLYEVVTHPGTLQVFGQHLTLTSASASKLYDGKPLSDPGCFITDGYLRPGHTLVTSVTASLTEAGTCDNVFTFTLRDGEGRDVSGEYDLECVFGQLTVKRAELLVASGDARKPYDGRPLTCAAYTVLRGAVAEGQSIVMNARGSQTEVGRSTNTFSIRVKDGEGRDVTVNYDVMLRPGTLVVYDQDHPFDEVDPDPGDVTVDPGDVTIDPGDVSFDPGDVSIDPGDITLDPNETYAPYEKPPTDPTKGELAHNGNNIPDEQQNVSVARIRSDCEGYLYLRYNSYGSYTGSGWKDAPEYPLPGELIVSPFVLPSLCAILPGTSSRLDVEWDTPLDRLLIPYYLTDVNTMSRGDAYILSGGLESYTMSFLPFDRGIPVPRPSVQNKVRNEELTMREWAYSEYLSLPQSTAFFMRNLARENGLNADDPDVIRHVAEFIASSMVYNKKMATIPDGVDVAVWALSEGKEGICQHFASAAVLMYRSLGIPARYVTGFRVYSEPGVWTDVTAARAHAWAEVYLAGCGWIPVEVTPGRQEPAPDDPTDRLSLGLTAGSVTRAYNGQPLTLKHPNGQNLPGDFYVVSGGLREGDEIVSVVVEGSQTLPGSSPSYITSFRIVDSEKRDVTALYDVALRPGTLTVSRIRLTVSSASAMKYEDGQPLTAAGCSYDETLLLPGHYLVAEAYGSRITAGESLNEIYARLLDLAGNDVSEYYDLILLPGRLTVKETPLGSLTIRTPSAAARYNGTPLSASGWELLDGQLAEGHVLIVRMETTLTNVGVRVNKPTILILDSTGNDVTGRYVLNTEAYGLLTVEPAPLTVTSADKVKTYDGTPLTANAYTVDKTFLAPRHRVVAVCGGSQTEIGESVNTLNEVYVLDGSGQDVTSNYSIRLVEGTLTVLP